MPQPDSRTLNTARATSLMIDVLVVIVTFVGLWAVTGFSSLWPALTGITLVVIASIVARGFLGSSVGHWFMRLRSIDVTSGLPSFQFRRPRSAVHRGSSRDPYALVPELRTAMPSHGQLTSRHLDGSHLRIIVDDGTSHSVRDAAVVGRDPTVPLDPRHTIVAVPDFTRTIARAHFLVEISDAGPIVTDLGGPSGTRLAASGEMLPAHEPRLIDWEAELLLGERRVLLNQHKRRA